MHCTVEVELAAPVSITPEIPPITSPPPVQKRRANKQKRRYKSNNKPTKNQLDKLYFNIPLRIYYSSTSKHSAQIRGNTLSKKYFYNNLYIAHLD